MSEKTKNSPNTSEQLQTAALNAGIVLMSAAATLGLIELPDHANARVILPGQASIVMVNERAGDDSNQIRREREDTAPHYISYSTFQRTPGRSGKA